MRLPAWFINLTRLLERLRSLLLVSGKAGPFIDRGTIAMKSKLASFMSIKAAIDLCGGRKA